MRYRRLGSTDLEVSEVGFPVATWTAGPLARPDEQVGLMLRRALDLGVTFFDMEDAGGDEGRAERLVGEAVRRDRDRATVATTVGYRPLEPLERATTGEWRRHDWSPQWVGRAIDQSLSGLGFEPIDLWQLHHPDMGALESDELFELLDDQITKGKIRAYGVALGPGPGWVDEGALAMTDRAVAAARTVFSVLEQTPARELAEVAVERGAGIVAAMPVDARRPDRRFELLDFLTVDRDQTLGQALVRFALTLPAAAAVLPAFEDADQLAELATASDLPDLTAEDLDEIADRYASGFKTGDRALERSGDRDGSPDTEVRR